MFHFRQNFTPTQEEKKAVLDDFGGELLIPENFKQTVPAYDPDKSKKENIFRAKVEINEQTTLLCSMLDLTDPNAVFLGKVSTFGNLDDASVGEDNDDDRNSDDAAVDDDEDEEGRDYDSEQSFIMSGSERSFSDRSYSMLSGNDSILSTGQGNDSIASLGNADEIDIGEEEEEEEEGEIVDSDGDNGKNGGTKSDISQEKKVAKVMGLKSETNVVKKRITVAERLKAVGNMSESNVSKDKDMEKGVKDDGSKAEGVDDIDDEFAAIIAAQKEHNSSMEGLEPLPSSETDSEELAEGDTGQNSSSSLDCKRLEITDADAELQEMLKVQKEAKDSDKNEIGSLKGAVQEVALEDDDLEMQDIIMAQKKAKGDIDTVPEFQHEFDATKPSLHSSPVVKDDRHGESSGISKNVLRREDSKNGESQSPAPKKLKRRNQSMYVSEPEESF